MSTIGSLTASLGEFHNFEAIITVSFCKFFSVEMYCIRMRDISFEAVSLKNDYHCKNDEPLILEIQTSTEFM